MIDKHPGPHTAEEWCAICDSYADENQRFSDEIDRLRAENAELRGALRSVLIDASNVTGQAWEDIREKAHAILAKTAPPGKEK